MQELLTAVTYPIVWVICAYLLKIESGLAKLMISLTAAILVYVLVGIMRSQKEKNKGNED
jgi:zinc transporter ZupT